VPFKYTTSELVKFIFILSLFNAEHQARIKCFGPTRSGNRTQVYRPRDGTTRPRAGKSLQSNLPAFMFGTHSRW